MKILTLILLALAGGIHWLRCNPNRNAEGKFMRNQPIERFGVYVVLALVALLVLAGCAKAPSRTVTGGSTSTLNEKAQTAVPPSYPPAYPQEQVAVTAPAAHPAPTTQLSSNALQLTPDNAFQLPAGWTFTRTTYFPPIPTEPPTVLNRTTNSTSTTQPSSTIDIIEPKDWRGWWIGFCLTAAVGLAVLATFTPAKWLYGVAAASVGVAAIALVPPAYLGVALLLTVVVLLGGVAFYAYRSGMWKQVSKELASGVDAVKEVVGSPEEINTILEAKQTVPKSYIRKARGK